MDLKQFLIQLGIETAADVLSTAISTLLAKESFPETDVVKTLKSLNIQDAEINAEKIIQFLAQKGDIVITGSSIHSNHSVEMKSGVGTALRFGNGSKSTTQKSSVEAGVGAHIQMNGGASMKQDEHGNIIFTV